MVFFSPKNTCTNTNCYSCVCNQCKDLWLWKALGLKFHVSAWVVTTEESYSVLQWPSALEYGQKLKRTPNTQLLKKFPGNFCCGCLSAPQLPSVNALWDAEPQLDWQSGQISSWLQPGMDLFTKQAPILPESLYPTIQGPKY